MKRNIFEKLGIDINDKNVIGFFKGFTEEYRKNFKVYNQIDTQEYFNNFIATLMLEYHKAYENFEIKIPYRIKSPKSVLDKLCDYFGRDDKSVFIYNSENELQGSLKDSITDMFALTIVACNRPPTFYSNDSEISELIEEKKRNHEFLGELQKFELQIKKDEFSGRKKDNYKYNCSKKEYYENCKKTIERIKTQISPEAVNLLAKYDEKLKMVNEILLNENELEKIIEKKDVSKIDFFQLEDDFIARLYDKIDLAVLNKQINSIFEKSKVLKKFGITLVKEGQKKKRTENGYVSNFVYLSTPFGKIEMQLQSKHENEEGNYGYAAHLGMQGKDLMEFELPPEGDDKKLNEFRTCVNFVSPKKYLAQFDSSEQNRILTQEFDIYQNYKSIMSQVKKGSNEDIRRKKYFGDLYSRKKEIFPSDLEGEKILSFIEYDIVEYLESEKFKEIIRNDRRRQEISRR